jgi:hypothetical protein
VTYPKMKKKEKKKKKKKERERERRRRRKESNVDRTTFKFMKNTGIDIGVRMRSQTRPN